MDRSEDLTSDFPKSWSAELLALYEQARAAPPAVFELAAVRQLGRLVGFDGAVWGQGTRVAGARQIDIAHATLFDRPPQLLHDYASVVACDPVTAAFLREPCRLQAIDVARDYRAPQVQPVRDYLMACDVGHLMLLGGPTEAAGAPGALSWITAYRAADESPFTAAERATFQALLPHWLCARQLCVAIHGEPGTPASGMQPAGMQPTGATLPAPQRLTCREGEVLNLVARGYTYSEAAQRMALSVSTVRSHVRTLYEKLDVHNKTEAVFEARQLGLLR